MKVALCSNTERDRDGVNLILAARALEKSGAEYCVQDYGEHFIAPCGVDMLIAFGGDGTLLNISKKCAVKRIPVLGINTGHLGFLTEGSERDIEHLLSAVIRGEYTIEERSMLNIEIDGVCYNALNDFTLTRGNGQHTVSIKLAIDGKVADNIIGDGILVGTPTGSTAYSLSCGGPILSPDLNAFVITAICPHSLTSRPIVVSDGSEIVLNAYNRDGNMRYSTDDEARLAEKGEITVRITRSDTRALFVRINQENFYSKLLRKLNYWNSDNREI